MVVSALSLAIVFYLAEPRKLAEALRLANFGFVALGFGLSLLWIMVRAVVWRTLLGERASLGQVFFTINEGYLLNNILPFRLGEVGRAYLLGRKARLDFWQVFSTIIIERVLDLAFAAGLLLSTLPFVVGAARAREASLVAGGVVLVGLICLFLLARNRAWAMDLFNRLSRRLPILARFGGKRLESFFDGLSVLTDGRRFLLAVMWMTINWAVALGQYYLLLRAFVPDARFLPAAFSLGVAALGVAAPSSPGSIGVLEASIVWALSVFGIHAALALAFALTAHLTNYLLTGVLGAIGLAQDGESLTRLYRTVRQIVQPGAAVTPHSH